MTHHPPLPQHHHKPHTQHHHHPIQHQPYRRQEPEDVSINEVKQQVNKKITNEEPG